MTIDEKKNESPFFKVLFFLRPVLTKIGSLLSESYWGRVFWC
jgi:hypothetical protein